jgi:hypothetical protein
MPRTTGAIPSNEKNFVGITLFYYRGITYPGIVDFFGKILRFGSVLLVKVITLVVAVLGEVITSVEREVRSHSSDI